MKVKLIAVGKMSVSDFNRCRAFRFMRNGYHYSCGSGESGFMHPDGVTYPFGKQPYRALSLIVRDDQMPKPKPMPIDPETQRKIDSGEIWHINIGFKSRFATNK